MSKESDSAKDELPRLPVTEIYDAIDTQFIEHDFDRKGTYLIGSLYGNRLKDIETFVDVVGSTSEPAFERVGKKLKQLPLGRYFREMSGFMGHEEYGWTFSPKVTLFFEAAKEVPNLRFKYPEAPYDDRTEGEVFNWFIEHMREQYKSRSFRNELRQQDFRSARRARKLKEYVNNLFSIYSRMLVIRIDLLYHGGDVSLEQALADFAKLVNNRRHNSVFEHQVGYIRRLEFGAVRDHHHFHVVFFFDGAKVRNDIYLAEKIGQYWRKVTEGRGHFHNCNREKHKYRRLGVGMISHDDTVMRDNLMVALAYLTKKDQLLWVPLGQKVRAIECGRLTGRAHSGKGRPRRSAYTGGESEAA